MIDTLDTVIIDQAFIDDLLSKVSHKNVFTRYSTLFIDGIKVDNMNVTLCMDAHTELFRLHLFFEVSYRDGAVDYEESVIELGRYGNVDDLISALYNGVKEFRNRLKRNLERI